MININKETETYIKIVSQCGSISKAAEKLSVSQPAISSQIRKAEQALGTELFDRSRHPLELTVAGRLVLDYITEKDALGKQLDDDLASISNLRSGKIRIGGASAFNLVYLPSVVRSYTEKYPEIDIQIIDGNMQQLADRTRDGLLDMFVSSPIPRTEGIEFERLLSTKIYLCVPADADVNEKLNGKQVPYEAIDSEGDHPEVGLEDFAHLPFIRLASERHLGHLLDFLIERAGMEKHIHIEVDQSITAYQMTAEGIGACLMSGVDIRNIAVDRRPVYYMVDSAHCVRDMYLATRAGRPLPPAAAAFAEEIREYVRKHT